MRGLREVAGREGARPEPVDVLAVMDALVESTARLAAGGTVTADPHTVEVAKRTRAAIAELIEADKAYDTARSRYDHAFRDGPHGNLDEQRDAQHMLREAKKRRAAALARVGG